METIFNNKTKHEIEQIQYLGLFVLDQENLLKMFPPKHSRVIAHHSTIWYKPQNLDGFEIGKKLKLKVLAEISDARGQALFVENPDSKNEYPHITISCAEGTEAVYSNHLLSEAVVNNTIKYFDQPVYVDVVTGYKTEDEEVVVQP